ncbi:radical SAM protein [Candidatus Woesearchaeota archaeon]|nr:radical SAM protein [Candidatus Woesearchaeota archaeon]
MEIIKIDKNSGIPLLGVLPFGIIDRYHNSMIQIRATTLCNANCEFCSTDAGVNSRFHKINYEVELDYLLEWFEYVAKLKKEKLTVFLDSVGEPLMYAKFLELVKGIKESGLSERIVTVTNGILLDKKKIIELKKNGLDQINLSLHTLDYEKGKKFFGMQNYDVDKIKETCIEIVKNGIELWLVPVYLPGVNDKDIEEIILFAKEINAKVGLQKYEKHKMGRKIKAKEETFFKFYRKLEELEKKFDFKLVYKGNEFKIKKAERVPVVFENNEKIQAIVKLEGWYSGQKIGVAKNRCVTILDCDKGINSRINVIIKSHTDGIYLAK